MTTFSRYYDEDGLLQETTMDELEELIKDESNKALIANLIYHRYYDRYLKIFDYQDIDVKEYFDINGKKKKGSIFNTEYKNGFAMMVNCCLLIETVASFLKGTNKTENGGGREAYKTVFQKATEYKNRLADFEDEPIYGKIRCGLLHQGETYGRFKIRRDGLLFENNTINATLFFKWLKNFLDSYRNDLSSPDTMWNDDIWDKCRDKLQYIIKHTRIEEE